MVARHVGLDILDLLMEVRRLGTAFVRHANVCKNL